MFWGFNHHSCGSLLSMQWGNLEDIADELLALGKMIKNEQQYQHSLDWLRRFEESVAQLDSNESNESLKAEAVRWQLHRDSYQSQVDELKEESAEYERLVNCENSQPIQIKVESLNKLPDALIKPE